MNDEEIAQLRAKAKLPLTIQLLDHIEALRAENERLKEAARTLLTEWDKNGPEKWHPLVEGDELMPGYWSPSGRMLETSVVASLRAALERKPE